MSLTVGTLRAILSVDDDQFTTGLTQAETKMKVVGRSIADTATAAGVEAGAGLSAGITGATIDAAGRLHGADGKFLAAGAQVGAAAGAGIDAGLSDGADAGTTTVKDRIGSIKEWAAGEGAESGAAFGAGMRDTMRNVLGTVGSLVAFAGLAVGIRDIVTASQEAAKTQAITRAEIEATGGVAGVTAAHVKELAQQVSGLDGVDRNTVEGVQNMLLIFPQIRDVVGKNNDIFDRATRITLDMSRATGKDAVSSARALGRALNDPAKGMALLTRSGIQFTAGQTATVKAMLAQGNLLGAQKYVLDALGARFGDVAERSATAGEKIGASMHNAAEDIGTSLHPAFSAIEKSLVPALTGAEPKIQAEAKKIGTDLAGGITRDLPVAEHAIGLFFAALTGGKVDEATGKNAQLYNTFANIGSIVRDVAGYIETGFGIAATVVGALAGPVEKVTGFLAQHKTVVEGIIIAYTAWKVITTLMRGAQLLLDAALNANPVSLIVLGIAGLIAVLVVAYQKSATFRDIVNAVGGVLEGVAKGAIVLVLRAIQVLTDTFTTAAGTILGAATLAFGWIPGIGPKLKEANADFQNFAKKINDDLNNAANAMYGIGKNGGKEYDEGTAAGITDNKQTVKAAAQDVASTAVSGVTSQAPAAHGSGQLLVTAASEGLVAGTPAMYQAGLAAGQAGRAGLVAGLTGGGPLPAPKANPVTGTVRRGGIPIGTGTPAAGGVAAATKETAKAPVYDNSALAAAAKKASDAAAKSAAAAQNAAAAAAVKAKNAAQKLRLDIASVLSDGVALGEADSEKAVETAGKAFSAAIERVFTDKDAPTALRVKLANQVADSIHTEQEWGERLDANTASLKAQEASLKSLESARTSYISSIAKSVLATSDLGSLTGGTYGPNSTQVTTELQQAVIAAKRFGTDYAKAQKMGLSASLLDQAAQLGPVKGDQLLAAIIAGGVGSVKTDNALQKQLTQLSNTIGTEAGNAMYQPGIDTAEGLIKGLESKRKDIEAVMRSIAQSMVKEFDKEMGIKSPSTKMHYRGLMTGLGYANGITASSPHVTKAMRSLTKATATGQSAMPGGLNLTAHVYVGDREITDIVRVELDRDHQAVAAYVPMMSQGANA